jgi:hypothetical protein
MSDPRTNLEIEDVLSSIRRLVSQEATLPYRRLIADSEPRPAEVDQVLQGLADDAPRESEAECLVLTPALRIETPEGRHRDDARQPAEPGAAPAPASDESDSADIGAELSRLEDTIAELEAAVADSGAEFEPEEGEKLEFDHDDTFTPLPTAFEELDEPEGDTEEPQAAGPDIAEHPVENDSPASTPVEPVAAGVETPTQAEDAGQDTPEEPSVDAAGETPAAADAPVPSRLHLGRAIDVAPRPQIHRATSVATPPSTDIDADAFALREVAEINEEVLETLVADIIRKELQGPLGERITRSVRKLVRREINRALTSQDFD